MTVLYPNLCYNEVCYKGSALYYPELFCLLLYVCTCYFDDNAK